MRNLQSAHVDVNDTLVLSSHISYACFMNEQTIDFDRAVGTTIAQYMFINNDSRSKVGKLLSITGQNISRRLHGHSKWSAEELLTLATHYGVSVNDLMPVRGSDGNWIPAPFKPGYAKAPALAGASDGWAHRESNPEPTD